MFPSLFSALPWGLFEACGLVCDPAPGPEPEGQLLQPHHSVGGILYLASKLKLPT